MKEFEKWIRGQDLMPAYPRYGTVDEDSAAEAGWKAALEWVKDKDMEQMRSLIEDELAC